MLERVFAAAVLASLMLLGDVALCQQSSQLQIGTVVPQRPCTFPYICDSETIAAPPAQTKVSVDEDSLTYVGSAPEVTRTDDLLTIMF
jgi:hypothetical protein